MNIRPHLIRIRCPNKNKKGIYKVTIPMWQVKAWGMREGGMFIEFRFLGMENRKNKEIKFS